MGSKPRNKGYCFYYRKSETENVFVIIICKYFLRNTMSFLYLYNKNYLTLK